MDTRADKATDSWYDFGNYITLGSFDIGKNMSTGLQYNAENMLNSPSDFINWMTIGRVDTINAVINPEESFSKDHWLASITLASIVAGGAKVPSGKTPTPNASTKVPSVEKASKTSSVPLVTKRPRLNTLTNIREWFRVNVPEIGLVTDGRGGYYFAVKKGDGGSSSGSGVKGTGNDFKRGNGALDNIIRDGSHKNKDGKLKPNIKYQAGEYDYLYKTDESRRLTEFNADELKLTERDNRLPHKSNTPGKEPGDHAGHLAADRFGGSPDLDNLVSQSSSVNLSKINGLKL